MLINIARKIFGTQNDRDLKSLVPTIEKINSLEPQMQALTNDELKEKTNHFKDRFSKGETLEQLLPEAFAVVREASIRVQQMRHYDVQLVGGIALHEGKIAEMKTGEGKTLVATLPIYLNALAGEGVHVVTVNDYLAERDSKWMGKVYTFLGMSTGVILHGLTDEERKNNYNADITYGTNNEFGFDYLRDNMKFNIEDYTQRPFYYCIVDEVDSILIDEARTPLIISGPTDDSTDKYQTINKIAPKLQKDIHYTIDEKAKSCALNEDGIAHVEKILNIENLYDPSNIDTLHHIQQAIRAHSMYRSNVDYVVKDNQVLIVDEFTGRVMPGRRWGDGLHQAIEAKEGVTVEKENQTLASVTFQNFFRMYEKLSGMTGTADTEAAEFKSIYKLDVLVIPTNRPLDRKDQNDLIYKDINAKFEAIAKEIQELHSKKQPMLVGTISIENSERLSRALKKRNIPHNVLNAKYHLEEASIIAQAGRSGSVTIATNMAGRGTDIVLGGNPEALAKLETQEGTPEFNEKVEEFKEICRKDRDVVVEAGGLMILGTERHESRRIDNQLRGRSGRQGDPGESRFFLSLEDDLFRVFGGERIKTFMGGSLDDEAIEHPWLSKAIANAQKKVEGHNFDIRKHLLQYDDVMNLQRTSIYNLRRDILEEETLEKTLHTFIESLAKVFTNAFAMARKPLRDWNIEGLNQALHSAFYRPIPIEISDIDDASNNALYTTISDKLKKIYQEKRLELGEHTQEVERMFSLSTIDQLWKEHLAQIDHLREGIGLRGYAQKDPLLEYKKESFHMFQNMLRQIKQDIITKIFNVQLREEEVESEITRYEKEKQKNIDMAMRLGNPGSSSPQPTVHATEKVKRNDPCPCGSGKKYKKCHGR